MNQDPYIQREAIQRLFDEATLAGNNWTDADLVQMLEHQLGAPLDGDLIEVDPRMEATLSEAATLCDVPVRTFGDALLSNHPRRAYLEMIKTYAKSLRQQPDAVMPMEIATVIYYTAIAAGVIHGLRISTLSNEKLRKGFDWALSQKWLTSEVRTVFDRAVVALR